MSKWDRFTTRERHLIAKSLAMSIDVLEVTEPGSGIEVSNILAEVVASPNEIGPYFRSARKALVTCCPPTSKLLDDAGRRHDESIVSVANISLTPEALGQA